MQPGGWPTGGAARSLAAFTRHGSFYTEAPAGERGASCIASILDTLLSRARQLVAGGSRTPRRMRLEVIITLIGLHRSFYMGAITWEPLTKRTTTGEHLHRSLCIGASTWELLHRSPYIGASTWEPLHWSFYMGSFQSIAPRLCCMLLCNFRSTCALLE